MDFRTPTENLPKALIAVQTRISDTIARWLEDDGYKRTEKWFNSQMFKG